LNYDLSRGHELQCVPGRLHRLGSPPGCQSGMPLLRHLAPPSAHRRPHQTSEPLATGRLPPVPPQVPLDAAYKRSSSTVAKKLFSSPFSAATKVPRGRRSPPSSRTEVPRGRRSPLTSRSSSQPHVDSFRLDDHLNSPDL
jgi:hypothetical protein